MCLLRHKSIHFWVVQVTLGFNKGGNALVGLVTVCNLLGSRLGLWELH